MIKKIALVVIVLANSWLAHALILTVGMALVGTSISLAEITGGMVFVSSRSIYKSWVS